MDAVLASPGALMVLAVLVALVLYLFYRLWQTAKDLGEILGLLEENTVTLNNILIHVPRLRVIPDGSGGPDSMSQSPGSSAELETGDSGGPSGASGKSDDDGKATTEEVEGEVQKQKGIIQEIYRETCEKIHEQGETCDPPPQ